jgi:diguanylate cyclase (GGDEF)-like protein/PAS domain S-box-containing protein
MSAGLEEDYEALVQFLYIAPIGLAQTRLDGEIVMVNPLCAQLLMPLARDGQLDNLFTALETVAPDLRHRARSFEADSGSICDALQLPVQPGLAGRPPSQVLSLSLLKLDGQRLMAVIGDVTQAVQRERELRLSQAWIQTLATGQTDYALVWLDAEGRMLAWNESIRRVTGFGPEASRERDVSVFYPADALPRSRLLERLMEADATGWSQDEGWRIRADGSRYWGSCLIAPLQAGERGPDARPQGYTLILRDVSEQRESTEALRRSVTCDHLTGLANRRSFYETAEADLVRQARSRSPVSLLMVDADHFKRINDRHGHAAGDQVLRHLAECVSSGLRAHDVAARLGGEEFVVWLPGTDADDATGVAERIRSRLAAQRLEVAGASIDVTVSIGVASTDAGVEDLPALLRRADLAMYEAKRLGRNRVQAWHAALADMAMATAMPG